MRIDTVFLNFAKACGKVNYKILLGKVAKQNIKGKLRRGIKEFLIKRKFKAVVHRAMSNKAVSSVVPKRMALYSILFIIMIPDRDKEVKDALQMILELLK